MQFFVEVFFFILMKPKTSDNKNMKKLFLLFSFFLFVNTLFCQENQKIPDDLIGIWEAKDRLIFFEEDENDENPELFVILKNFYGWYYDRSAESEKYSQKAERTRNDATPKTAEKIPFSVTQNQNYNTFYFDINYSSFENCIVPLVLINDNFFLNFYTRDLDFENPTSVENAKQTYDGFYRGNIVSKGIMISNQSVPENISCFYILGNKIYNIRYWKTDMDFSSDYVTFSYNEDSFLIPRHIQTGKYIYSCVNGRSKKVRNPQAPKQFNVDDYIFNENHTVMVVDKNIYLTKLADKSTFEDLIQIVKNANSKKRPVPTQVFPKSDLVLDFHWDLIDYLEKDNQLIQAVRKRQKEFGPRAKDFE